MDVKTAILGCLVAATLALSLNSAPLLAAGETYYRWLDDRGNPVHSDRPPPSGVDYEVISTGGNFKRTVTGNEGAVPRDMESKPGNTFEKEALKPEAEIKKNSEVCSRARENLTTLETWDVVNVKDDQGNPRPLTEAEKEQRKAEALRQISLHCE